MLNIPALDFFLSMVFIFLLFSMFCSWIVEAGSRIFNLRGKHLRSKLRDLINDEGGADWYGQLMAHPLVESLSKSKNKPASYIDPKLFSRAITDVIHDGPVDNINFMPTIGQKLDTLEGDSLIRSIKVIHRQSAGDKETFLSGIEDWYNRYMDRVSIWYKQQTRIILFCIGIIIALLLNVDTVRMTKMMWNDAQLRQSVASQAQTFADTHEGMDPEEAIPEGDRKALLSKTGIPISWRSEIEASGTIKAFSELSIGDQIGTSLSYWMSDFTLFLNKLLGFVISAFVVTLGAPFWFDLLRKITSVRTKSG